MWLLYILGIIIAIAIDYIIAKQFAAIAEMKGHNGDTYFWFTFIFGIIGMLMVVALPAETNGNGGKTTSTQLPPAEDFFAKMKEKSDKTVKRCPYCGDVVKMGRCEMCGKEVD